MQSNRIGGNLEKNEQNIKIDGWMVMKFDNEIEHRK